MKGNLSIKIFDQYLKDEPDKEHKSKMKKEIIRKMIKSPD